MLGTAAALVVLAVVLGAWRRLPDGAGPLVPLAIGGLVLALAPRVPGAEQLMRWVVADVPGGGLLRDSQKWIAPLVVLATLSLAVSLDRFRAGRRDTHRRWREVVAGVGICLPFVLLPDAAGTTWDAVRPVPYPREFSSIRDQLAASPDHGAMVLLPWRAYRSFDWGNPRSRARPGVRMVRRRDGRLERARRRASRGRRPRPDQPMPYAGPRRPRTWADDWPRSASDGRWSTPTTR